MSVISDLLTILDLEPLEQTLFRGRVPQVGWQRVFGGLVISQALVAAHRTVDGREPHSLHGYFLLGGDPSVPIIYDVDRIRDGRSFTTRRVVAIQHGRPIFAMSCSFHEPEDGFDHQATMPDVPMPEDLPSIETVKKSVLPNLPHPVRAYFERERPIELRPVDFERYTASGSAQLGTQIWIRAAGRLPDDPGIHQSVLAYASDMTLLDCSLVPHNTSVFDPGIAPASLDHAMWFHRPFRADEWLLYSQESPNACAGRGFSRGLVFRRDGTLVASVAQEGLIRRKRP
ncbi:MAG TPA: acyl-CoA thioesterase II [Beijerinckiaceae bacterium]|nr:acyl-CoA thioesterase II [Beijerinckiaceae bacterium]